MKRISSLVLVICLMTFICVPAYAIGLQTSSYADAESYVAMRHHFENVISPESAANATVGMVLTVIGRSWNMQADTGIGIGHLIQDKTPLYSQPDTNSNILRYINTHTNITANSVQDGWYSVTAEGLRGYLPIYTALISCEAYPELSYSASYTPYMIWGYEAKIIEQIDPDTVLNREELSSLLFNISEKLCYSLPDINTPFAFTDAGAFTVDPVAVQKMQTAGIIIEKPDGSFSPDDPVSASELQGILLRYLHAGKFSFDSRVVPIGTITTTAPVDDNWFDDACFIGHSQVVGMSNYFKLPNADYYAIIGHTAREALEFPYYPLPNGGDGALSKALSQRSYGKVYIMLGINDCTNKDDQLEKFLTPMREILDLVHETQPQAQVYMISLAPTGRETPNNICYSLDNVLLFTQAVKSLSREYNTEYLDLFRFMSDENGYMLNEFNAGDGIHIDAHHYDEIKDFLKCHTK